jgi:hypothetical protein
MRSDGVIECVLVRLLRSAKRQVADMMRSASARFVERDFDPGLPQRVLWSNFRRLGFCNSSDFSSLRVGVKDFSDYFANDPVQIRFVILVSSNVFQCLRVSLLMLWGQTVFMLKSGSSNYFRYCLICFDYITKLTKIYQ